MWLSDIFFSWEDSILWVAICAEVHLEVPLDMQGLKRALITRSN
jgi:hypothetical protein